ncbi:hypothetical protein K2173_011496 [Erythroxylum novogranatense]|uniref:Flocculation protein n=1 Tax=Erythroxylum novogranatense TaxID=1862640 RepID=A0AAV8TUJ1_9ROSI|nr:hypothetical protein K2173_011496 [Erythroxylum novogranatense]
MSNNRKQEFNNDGEDEMNEEFEDSSSISNCSDSSTVRATQERSEIGLTERLTDILLEQGDGDLLLQRSDREDRLLQWLQALDMQVMGACRADERLRPLLKANASSGLAEDRLLAYLNQHFEPSEVGMLARCFCIPLVSIRVGKINKLGTLLCPTSIRGNLNLTLLPTSDLRLSFIGDDGNAERLFTLSSTAECAAVNVEEIPVDSSGRSFHIKIEDDRDVYFWCSEKSKLLGIELLAKMKDILKRKPSISELTGISNSRLDCFATHLRTYLVSSIQGSSGAFSSSSATMSHISETMPSKSIRARHVGNQSGKAHLSYQGSLSPRPSSFKDGLPKSLSSLRNASREKLRRHVDSSATVVDTLLVAVPQIIDAPSSCQSVRPEVKSCLMNQSSLIDSVAKLAVPPTFFTDSFASSTGDPLFSSHCCWRSQGTSTVQCPSSSPELPLSSIESPLLPPLSSLLSATRSSGFLTSASPLTLADVPSLDFPAFLSDPMVQLSRPISQQFPIFTPLMCDPIVHIPVIDVCSSGQGFLVSAGQSISSNMPPLKPMIPESESVVEKGARETLQLLLSGSSPASPPLIDVLPSVLNHNDDHLLLVTRSGGMYNGSRDVEAIAKNIATVSLVSFSGSSIVDGVGNVSGSSGTLLEGIDVLQDGSTAANELTFNHKGTQPCKGEESTS